MPSLAAFRSVCSLFLLAGLVACQGASTPAGEGARQSGPVSAEATVDALFADYDVPGSPGAQVAVYSNGETVLARAYGEAELETGRPLTPQTPIMVASVSKQFTAFAIALLAQEGKLDLDADIRTYLPGMPDFGRRITVRHLILHTSGLREQSSLSTMMGGGGSGATRQEQMLSLARHQRTLNFDPGSEHMYCNTGYTLLAEIVRAASGQSLREFAEQRIFAPLGMTDSFFRDDAGEIIPGGAVSYLRAGSDGDWKQAPLHENSVGATGLWTTVEDLAKWARNFSHPKVGDAALIEQVTRSGTLDDGAPINYAFALEGVQLAGRKVLMHTGSQAGFRAIFAYYPEHDFAVVIAANHGMGHPERREKVAAIANAYLPALASPDTVLSNQQAPELLQALAGRYQPPQGNSVVLAAVDGRLHQDPTQTGPGTQLYLREDGSVDDGMRAEAGYRQPERDAGGRVVALTEHDAHGRLLGRWPRIEDGAPALEAAVLAGYAGRYRSDELDVTYTVEAKEGRLYLTSLLRPAEVPLRPTTRDRFDTEGGGMGGLAFVREGAGRVVAVTVDGWGSYDVRFDRVGVR